MKPELEHRGVNICLETKYNIFFRLVSLFDKHQRENLKPVDATITISEMRY